MTFYTLLSRRYDGFHFLANEAGFVIILGWISFGVSLHHLSDLMFEKDMMLQALLLENELLKNYLEEKSPGALDELYEKAKAALEKSKLEK